MLADPAAPPLSAGQGVALCVLGLLTIGVVMVNSAGMSVDQTRAVTAESLLLSKSTIYMALAMLALMATALMPIRRIVARLMNEPVEVVADGAPRSWLRDQFSHWLGLWPLWAFVCVMIALLGMVYAPGIGKEVNHSHRWVNLHVPGLDSVQPSEIAKWALIIAMAWFACRNARHMNSFWKGLVPGLAAAGAVSAVIVLEDLGTGALLGMVACIILIAAGVRFWHLLILAPLPIAALAAAIVTSPYRMHRILAFLNPYEDAQGIGYHMIQSMVAVANGQFFGRGLGHGLQKFGYLPEDTTDFLFAIICEELGVFGAALVIFLYGAMLWCILGIIKREPSRFLRLVALGVMATVGLQAVINLAVVTGLGPTKGIALPLLSSGGTGWILTAASLGLVIAMDRTRADAFVSYKKAVVMTPPTVEVEVETAEPVLAVTVDEPVATPAPVQDDSRFAPQIAELITTVELIDTDSSMLIEEDQAASEPTITSTDSSVETPNLIDQSPMVVTSMDVAPGETGMLFAEPPAADQTVQTPEVVVTDEGRDWPPTIPSTRISPA